MRKIGLVILLLLSSIATAETGLVLDVVLTPTGSFKAKTSDVKGSATVSGDTVSAENITIKLKNLKTGLALRDKHMTEKYLEVGKFPEAVLLSATGKGGKGKGRLKVRNIEMDVEGTYKVEGSELTADFQVKASDFGITGVKYMGVGVNDNVTVHITLPVQKTETKKAAVKK